MPAIVIDDGVTLHAEETGAGAPLVFIHEFAGDHRSWEPQVRYFSAAYRCVTYAARGYPPSDVPTDPAAYSQDRAVADAIAVLDGLGIARANVVGLSMGGFTALHLALNHPDRVISAVVAGAGARRPARPSRCLPGRVHARRRGVRGRGRGQGRRALCGRSGPGPVPEQEPARLGRVRRGAGRTLLARRRPDHARRPGRTALAVRAHRPARPAPHSGPGAGRRRGRGLPGASPDAQAHHPRLRPGRPAAHRPHRQPGGTRRVQPRRRQVPGPPRPRRLARACPPLAVRLDDRHELTRRTGTDSFWAERFLGFPAAERLTATGVYPRSEEHTSEL